MSKLTDLTLLPDVQGADLIYVVDVSDTSDDPEGSSRQATLQEVFDELGGVTTGTDAADLSSGTADDGQVLTADGNGGAAWETPTMGSTDADTLDGQGASYYLNRSNHTGTQALNTISDAGEAAAADIGTASGELVRSQDFQFATLEDLIDNAPRTDGFIVELLNVYVGQGHGGGQLYWDADRDKSTANGGSIIDPDTTGGWDGTSGDIDTYLTAQGTGSGQGCFVRTPMYPSNIWWWGATGSDSAADASAFAKIRDSLGVAEPVWQPSGDFGGKTSLYPSTPEGSALSITVGADNSEAQDDRALLYLTKHTSLNRDSDPDAWDQGCIYAETEMRGGDAFAVGISGTARASGPGATGGQLIGVRGGGVGRTSDAEVFGMWAYVDNAFGPQWNEGIGLEVNVQTQFDAGWQETGGGNGGARGINVVTADESNRATTGVLVGAQAGSEPWYTGFILRQDGIVPSGYAGETSVPDNEAYRVQGASSDPDSYGGIRFDKGYFDYGISFTEADGFAGNCAMLLGGGHEIRWGDGPASGTFARIRNPDSTNDLDFITDTIRVSNGSLRQLTFLDGLDGGTVGAVRSNASSFNPGLIDFTDDDSGAISLNIAGGITGFRVAAGDASDPCKIRVGSSLEPITAGAADSGGTGFRVLRVPN